MLCTFLEVAARIRVSTREPAVSFLEGLQDWVERAHHVESPEFPVQIARRPLKAVRVAELEREMRELRGANQGGGASMSASSSAHVLDGNSARGYVCPELPVMGGIRDSTEATACRGRLGARCEQGR